MIKTDINVPVNYNSESIKDAICAHLPISRDELTDVRILKKTLKIDAEMRYALSVGISLSAERESGLLKMKKKVSETPSYEWITPQKQLDSRPVVVGAGPAGLFAALVLAEAGARPVIIERGDRVEERQKSVSRFFTEGVLDTESNVQFGEGGAGAFSDGKLKVGGMDKYKYKVLSEFVSAGAPEEIIYTVGAHLGTDKLPCYVRLIREKIMSLGGEFIYRARVCDIEVSSGKLVGIIYEKNGINEKIPTTRAIFATGHSAKDTFEMLLSHGAPMQARPFGIGVRIEHKREYINKLVLGTPSPDSNIGTASYHLVTHLPNGRSVYSFCMCPGGTVVAAASETGGIVTNGMSEEARAADNSNAAHLVSVFPSDFGTEHPLGGMYMQRFLEREAYNLAGGNWSAPACRMENLISGAKADLSGDVVPSYPCGVSPLSTDKYLPSFISESLRCGILDFDDYMKGFYHPDAVLTGTETRSTSPVRIIRNDRYAVPTLSGLYPIGEGAGYAGGIVSSAVDGLRVAESILLSDDN